MNTYQATGYIASEPIFRYTKDNVAYMAFILKVMLYLKGKKSEYKGWQFISCMLWGSTGEKLIDRVQKGTKVAIVGSLRTTTHIAKNTGYKYYKTECIIRELEILKNERHPDLLKEKELRNPKSNRDLIEDAFYKLYFDGECEDVEDNNSGTT